MQQRKSNFVIDMLLIIAAFAALLVAGPSFAVETPVAPTPSASAPAPAAPAHSGDSWGGRDKAQHFVVGAVIALGVTAATEKPLYGFAAGCGAGGLKELYDRGRPGHTASGRDFVVTCLGAGLGAYTGGLIVGRSNGQTTVSYYKEF